MSARTPITIRYATTDADVVYIHRFLCVVGAHMLPAPIDARDSATEVWRVAQEDVALMAMADNMLIGTMGIISPTAWWNRKHKYLADRWFLVLPGSGGWLPLVHEAKAIAKASDMELTLVSEERGKVRTYNRNAYRKLMAAAAQVTADQVTVAKAD